MPKMHSQGSIDHAGELVVPRRHYARLAALAAANLSPAVLLFYFVWRFGTDLPLWDEWNAFILNTIQLRDQGMLGLSALFAQHNEHRIVFPRLLTLANAHLFHWNRVAEMYVTAALLVLAAFFLYRLLRESNVGLAPLYFIPMVWTLMSWRQWSNLLKAFQSQVGLLVAGVTLAVYLLHRIKGVGRYTWLAAAAGFIASFSFAAGLLVWPVGLFQLVMERVYGKPGARPGPGAVGVWCGAGAFTYVLYFVGYFTPPTPWPHGLAYLLHHPVEAGEYTAILIGSPLSFRPEAAGAMGVLLIALGAYALFMLFRLPRTDRVRAAPWLALILFTLLSSAVICDGRLGLGLGGALSSRYCSITMLGIVAVYALLIQCSVAAPRPATVVACGSMLVLLVFGIITNYIGWRVDPVAQQFLDTVEVGAYAVRNADVVSDDVLMSVHPMPQVVREGVAVLKAHRYSLFHNPAPALLPPRYNGQCSQCCIDTVNGRVGNTVEVHRRTEAGTRFEGWAVDNAASQTPSRVFVSIDGRLDFPALLGRARPDVASAFHNPNYEKSGIVSYVRTALISPGDHSVSLKIVSRDGSGYWTCPGSGVFRIRVVE
jgi:hypothetical protein